MTLSRGWTAVMRDSVPRALAAQARGALRPTQPGQAAAAAWPGCVGRKAPRACAASARGTLSRMTAVHPLDNVIWSALTTQHVDLARGGPLARRYQPDFARFAGMPA